LPAGKEPTLPPSEWLNAILARDFSEFEPVEGDTEAILTKKASEMEARLKFFDFYVDKMLPTCAGTKMWHTGVRHFECVSTSKLPNHDELRVSVQTEALCALLYKNAREKWIATYKFKVANRGTGKKAPAVPRYNPKEPTKNTEFVALYSDPFSGQSKLGGWNKQGRKFYAKMGKLVKATRTNHAARCVKVETTCFQRLHEQNKEVYDKREKKKRKIDEIVPSDDESSDLEWV
jgi:hypothetical protein